MEEGGKGPTGPITSIKGNQNTVLGNQNTVLGNQNTVLPVLGRAIMTVPSACLKTGASCNPDLSKAMELHAGPKASSSMS